MEPGNVNVDEYGFQLELEEETRRIQEKEESQCSTAELEAHAKRILAQFKTTGVCMSAQLEAHGLHISMEEKQSGKQEARLAAQTSLQLEEQEVCITAQVSS